MRKKSQDEDTWPWFLRRSLSNYKCKNVYQGKCALVSAVVFHINKTTCYHTKSLQGQKKARLEIMINCNHPFDSKCFLRIILFSYLEILMVRDVELFLVFRIHAQDPPLWSSNLRGTFARGSNHMVVCVSVNMGYDQQYYTLDLGSSARLSRFAILKVQAFSSLKCHTLSHTSSYVSCSCQISSKAFLLKLSQVRPMATPISAFTAALRPTTLVKQTTHFWPVSGCFFNNGASFEWGE